MRAAANQSPTGACARVLSVRLTAGRSILAVLFTFHGWLLWVHAVTGRLWDPATTFRWIAAAFILAGFVWLRRSGRPLARGRRALVFWLLVAMLHANAAVDSTGPVPAAAVPETVHAVLAEIAAAPVILLGACLLLLLARRHIERPQALALAAVRRFMCGTPPAGNRFLFSPRPPPRILSI